VGQEPGCSSAVGYQTPALPQPCPARLWALLSWALIPQLILWHDVGAVLSLRACAVILGLYLSLLTLMGPDPQLLIDFLV